MFDKLLYIGPQKLLSFDLFLYDHKGVYPQNNGGIAIVAIDASKVFIALWVHLFVAIEWIHQNRYRRKRYVFGFD